MLCPKCSAPRKGGISECPECGVIYSKAKPRPRTQSKKLPNPWSVLGWGLVMLVFFGYHTYNWWDTRDERKQARIEASKPPVYTQWNNGPVDIRVTQTIIENGIKGCGDLMWKQSLKHQYKYIIACSRDGRNWRHYELNTEMSIAVAIKS